ncbi:hypothetical protein SISSUDRAFT_1012327 [Sistotremastrum suecicum HHB10207 ss-3]|uniref:Phosphatidylglycerol/phosphatidylinositol transfer protein n=1 Tax=Sistotremastrum suecicum HHB10207 ss-3 TaxID=1314776 RepID=A0A165WP98_9AGAM|nr:hypothetical protein SISSUDRAFT_1012327 [Sistotremastrum suecicum HHB10207 ss-3]
MLVSLTPVVLFYLGAFLGFAHASPGTKSYLRNGQQPLEDSQVVHSLASWEWQDCGSPDDVGHIDRLVISPDPPQPGHDLTVSVDFTVDEDIVDGAEVDVQVKAGLLKILTQTFDICEEAEVNNAELQCPVKKGSYKNISQVVALPKEIPPAIINVDVQGYTVDDDDLMCLKIVLNFRK